MEFNYIVNPESGRRVSIYGKTGQRVLRNYLQAGGAMRSGSRIPPNQYCHNGGAMRSGSRIPPQQYCQNGGNKCKQYKKTKEPKCEEQDGCKWVVRQGCLEDEVHVPLSPEPKRVTKTTVPKPKSSRKNCKAYKKTREPKCEEQDGCYWVTNEGCLNRMSDSDEESHYEPEPVKPRAPMRASADVKKTGKRVKTTTTKKHGKTQRLSAGEYYRNYGQDSTLGDRCNIRQDGEYKCMTKTKTNVARWGKCPSDYNLCKDEEYR